VIDRRILVNFTADPDVVRPFLPQPFRPKIYKGKAIVGICLIRLKEIRLKGMPKLLGLSSENGAHRIAVEWDEGDEIKSGVYIPRRDTSSFINTLAGGRFFPGKHYRAAFNVRESEGNYHVDFTSSDQTTISIDARESQIFNSNSIFQNLHNASDFFENGSVGYSPNGNKFEGMKLRARDWKVRPMEVSNVHSSFYEDKNIFPEGSVTFDNALLMTGILHEWESLGEKTSSLRN